MKTVAFIGILGFLLASNCFSQNVYSKQNLEKASTENLDIYLKKAHIVKSGGSTVTVIGLISTVAGVVFLSTGKETYAYTGFYLSVFGLGVTAIGLPILYTGSLRIKKINDIKNINSEVAFIEIALCRYQNDMVKGYQTGVSLRLRF